MASETEYLTTAVPSHSFSFPLHSQLFVFLSFLSLELCLKKRNLKLSFREYYSCHLGISNHVFTLLCGHKSCEHFHLCFSKFITYATNNRQKWHFNLWVWCFLCLRVCLCSKYFITKTILKSHCIKHVLY